MAANSDVGIELKARTDEFEAKLKKAVGSFESLAIKGRDVSKSLDTSFRGISTVAQDSVNKIERSFNSLSIKSDFSLNIQKEALALNVKFFERQYSKIAADARSSAADVERAFTAMNDKVRQLNEQPMKNNFSALGIMPTSQIEAEKAKLVRAFEEIKTSGTASAKDITRAHEAMSAELRRLDGHVTNNTQKMNLFGLASVGAILKIQVLYSLVNTVMSGLGSLPGLMMNSVESFNAAAISNAAIITSMQKGTEDIGKRYQENKIYAEAVQEVLIKMDAQTAASGQNLTDMNRKFVDQGVLIDTNNKKQIDGMLNIANALAALTAGDANANLQYSQEISALMRGENRPSNKLFQLLNGMDNGKLKEHLDLWRKTSQETGNYGLILEKIGPMLNGFAAAQGDINALWSTTKSTMETIRDQVLRQGFGPEFALIVGKMRELGEYADANKDKLAAMIQNGFLKLNSFVEGIVAVGSYLVPIIKPMTEIVSLLGVMKLAQLLFNMACRANPYILGATVAYALGSWFVDYLKDVKKATDATRDFNNTMSISIGKPVGVTNVSDWKAGNSAENSSDFNRAIAMEDQSNAGAMLLDSHRHPRTAPPDVTVPKGVVVA